jgi:hypothetical protein
MHACALRGGHRGDGAHFPQPLSWAGRQFEAGGVRPIDDIDVVIAWQDQEPSGEPGIRFEGVEELGPFRGTAGVRHVAGDEDRIKRVLPVNVVEPRQRALEPIIATRTRPAALDAKSITPAHNVDVGQVRDAPPSIVVRERRSRIQVAWLIHRCIGDA